MSVSNAQGTVYYNVGSAASTSSSTSIPTRTDAGTYVVHYLIGGNSNYSSKTGSVSVTIAKKEVTANAPTISGTLKFKSQLTATAPATSQPTGANVAYQWYRQCCKFK